MHESNKKIVKICDIKKLKAIPWPAKKSVTFYQTLKKVFWTLGPEKLQQ